MKSNKVGVVKQQYCKICNVEVMSKNFSRHKNSKKHKLKEVKNGGILEEQKGGIEERNGGISEVQNGGIEVRNGGISEVQNRETEVQNGGKEVQKNKIYTKRKGGDRSKAPKHEGADIRDSSTKLLPNPPWQKYQGEIHLENYNYAGPGTRTDIRLDENDNPKPGEEPINKIDEACLKHDIAYESDCLLYTSPSPRDYA